jgi:hypothetical protein
VEATRSLRRTGYLRSAGYIVAMPKLQHHQQVFHNWAIYHSGQTPARLVGFVEQAPDSFTAIERAIKELKLPASDRGLLVARRRD